MKIKLKGTEFEIKQTKPYPPWVKITIDDRQLMMYPEDYKILVKFLQAILSVIKDCDE